MTFPLPQVGVVLFSLVWDFFLLDDLVFMPTLSVIFLLFPSIVAVKDIREYFLECQLVDLWFPRRHDFLSFFFQRTQAMKKLNEKAELHLDVAFTSFAALASTAMEAPSVIGSSTMTSILVTFSSNAIPFINGVFASLIKISAAEML